MLDTAILAYHEVQTMAASYYSPKGKAQPLVHTFFLALRCFVSVLRLLFSVRGSLFLPWPFFVCTIASSVTRCFRVLLLWSVTRSDLRFYLSVEVARWNMSLLFLSTPSHSIPVVRQTWSAVSCFCSLAVSGFFSLPSSFCLHSFRPLYWWVSFPSSFLCFSSSSAFLFCLLPFASTVLWHSSLFLHEVLWHFLPWFGFLPSGSLFPRPFVSPHLVPSGFVLPLLVPAFSFGLLFVSLCASSRLACLALGPFLHLLVLGSSFLFLSLSLHLVFLVTSYMFSLGFLIRLFFGWRSRFYLSIVLPFRLSRFHSFSTFEFVPSVVCGVLPFVFLF